MISLRKPSPDAVRAFDRGLARAAAFSWSRTAREVDALLRTL